MLGEDPWIFLFWEEISKKTIKNTDLEGLSSKLCI